MLVVTTASENDSGIRVTSLNVYISGERTNQPSEPCPSSAAQPSHSPLTPRKGAQMAFNDICKLSFNFIARCAGYVCAGMPLMLCGHFFLKLSHAPEYQDATFPSSLQVGALGGLLMAIPMMIIEWIIKKLPSCSFSLPKSPSNNADNTSTAESQGTAATAKETPIAKDKELPLSIGWLVVQLLLSIASVVGLGAGTGYFGSSVLIATGHDVLGVLAATRAGAVGTAILGPGAIVAVFLLFLCCGGTAALTLLIARAGGDNEASDSQLEMGKVPETEAPNTVVKP